MDSTVVDDGMSFNAIHAITDGLTAVNEKGKTAPAIAKSWDVSDDGKTYTLTVSNDGKELFADGASVAKIEGTEVAYQETDEAKAILNTYSHNETPFSAKMDMVLTNQCNMRLPMTDGKFNADFLRPINVHANEGQFFVDATDDGYTVNVLDLVYLTDWRDYKFAKVQAQAV